jgi:hypothetical protein
MSKTSPYNVAAVAVAAVIAVVYVTKKPGQEKAPLDPEREARFQKIVAGAMWLKTNQKNPASFELVSATMPDSATACYVYRGTNSFGAVVTQRHVISNMVNSGELSTWAKHCDGRSGEDFSFARQAL